MQQAAELKNNSTLPGLHRPISRTPPTTCHLQTATCLPKRQGHLSVEGLSYIFFAGGFEALAGTQFGDEGGDAVLVILREIGGMPEEFAAAQDADP